MISLLLDLPNELLLEVFSYLDDNSINTLFGFGKIRDRVGSQFAVICHQSECPDFLPSIPRWTEALDCVGELRGISRIIVVLKNSVGEVPALLLQGLPTVTHTYVLDRDPISIHKEWSPVFDKHRVHSITLHSSDHTVHIHDIIVNTETTHLAGVKTLHMQNCHITNTGRTIYLDCPELSNLRLNGLMEPIAAFNPGTPHLASLDLEHITDTSVWKNTCLPFLQILKITSGLYDPPSHQLKTLEDLSFQRLQTLTVTDGLIESLSRLHLPQLTELFISTHGELSIMDIYAPMVKNVTLSAAQLLIFKSNTLTSIVSFDFQSISPNPFPRQEDVDFSPLTNLKTLLTTSITADHILSFTKGISDLTTSGRIPDLSQFFHLTNLTLYHARGRGLKQLKEIKSLKSLTFLSSNKILFIDYILQMCPRLEDLVVRNSPFRKCLNIRANKLKRLELSNMTTDDSFTFSFKGCAFPQLESLFVAVIELESPSRWGLIAPELRKIDLRTTSKEINLSSFSNLEELTVGGSVEVIKAVRCINLTSIIAVFAKRLQVIHVAAKDKVHVVQSEFSPKIKINTPG